MFTCLWHYGLCVTFNFEPFLLLMQEAMVRVVNNAYKQYCKSRPAPSSESLKRSRSFSTVSVGFHPMFSMFCFALLYLPGDGIGYLTLKKLTLNMSWSKINFQTAWALSILCKLNCSNILCTVVSVSCSKFRNNGNDWWNRSSQTARSNEKLSTSFSKNFCCVKVTGYAMKPLRMQASIFGVCPKPG